MKKVIFRILPAVILLVYRFNKQSYKKETKAI